MDVTLLAFSLVLAASPVAGVTMHDDVPARERDCPADAPGLAVVSDGDPDEVRAGGFESPRLPDPEWAAAGALPLSTSG